MSMLLTTTVFVALTLLSVALHVRRTEGGVKAKPAGSAARRCARCGSAVPERAATCPRCGVPQQVFEVVSAPEAQPRAESGGPLRAMVRADLCVGCAACVAACPETGAITMRGKLAAVDAEHCVGHGECASACPVGAIGVGDRLEDRDRLSVAVGAATW